jgi:hypothetical protein
MNVWISQEMALAHIDDLHREAAAYRRLAHRADRAPRRLSHRIAARLPALRRGPAVVGCEA